MSESNNPWACLVEEQRSRFREKGYDPPQAIKSNDTFRTAIERLCDERKEKYPQRLLSGLCSSYATINNFAEAIARAQRLPPDAITGLIWAASTLAISCGSKAGASLNGVAKLVTKLNFTVPAFSTSLGLFAEEPSVQRPLQDIFSEYISSLLSFVTDFNDMTYNHSFDPSEDDNLKRRIEEVAEALKEAKEEYDDAVAREENKLSKRPRMDLPSRQKSSYLTNGLGEPERHGTDLHALFIHQRMLGRGTQGEVHEVKEPTTGQCYARKQIYFRRDRSFSDEEEVLNEVKIMGKLHHPHIATVSFFVKESDAYSIIMQPVADSDLLGYLNRCIQLDFKPRLVKWIYSWFGSLVDALRYAHDCNVKHRDIKPANILIKDHRPYLSDFGIAKDFTGVDTSSTHEYFAQGTPVYRAPEAKASNARGRLADVFALGCVFSEMLTVNRGRSLEEFREFRQVEDSSSGPFAFRDNLEKVGEWLAKFETGDQLSNIIVEQIRDMLKEKPSARSSAEKVHDCLKRETAFFCRD